MSEDVLTLLSNVIDINNLPGSRRLDQQDPQNSFSRDVLASSERYGLYLSALLENAMEAGDTATDMVLVRDNICESAAHRDMH